MPLPGCEWPESFSRPPHKIPPRYEGGEDMHLVQNQPIDDVNHGHIAFALLPVIRETHALAASSGVVRVKKVRGIHATQCRR
eukprot:6208533-Pleurochrysis_carterae.AAC.4